MTLSEALKLVTSLKHKQALAILAPNGYIMDNRLLGRNNAYKACQLRGFKFDKTMKAWLKR